MADGTEGEKRVTFEEFLVSNMLEIQAVAQLLVEKGIITEQEYYDKLKAVQMEYRERQKR